VIDEKGAAFLENDEAGVVEYCARFAAAANIAAIRQVLQEFGIEFQHWFSEQSLYDAGEVDRILAESRERGIIYEKDGALWFKTSDLGDEKDRVVVRQNGKTLANLVEKAS
jgi:arginyl-tRNA synthetase